MTDATCQLPASLRAYVLDMAARHKWENDDPQKAWIWYEGAKARLWLEATTAAEYSAAVQLYIETMKL